MGRWLTVVALAAFLPNVARAELYYLSRDAGALRCLPIGTLDCAVASCEVGCGPIGSGIGCHYGPDTLLCCEADGDCHIDDGFGVTLMGQCDRVTGLTADPGRTVFGVCTFTDPPEAMFCGASTAARLAPCVPPGNDWGDGDCDGDGTINAEDETPCGIAAPDAGASTPDAGGLDAATPALDGGAPDAATPDAAAPSDGGFDAATFDGALPPATFSPRFGGGGGCVCRAAPRPRGGDVLVGLLVALALVQRRPRAKESARLR
ncbi:MAG: hypothetical protein R3B82_22250 [Sandaracinaceae bacterium]